MMAHQVVPQMKRRAMTISMMASVTLFPPNLKPGLPNQKVLIAMMAVTANVPPTQSGLEIQYSMAPNDAKKRPPANLHHSYIPPSWVKVLPSSAVSKP